MASWRRSRFVRTRVGRPREDHCTRLPNTWISCQHYSGGHSTRAHDCIGVVSWGHNGARPLPQTLPQGEGSRRFNLITAFLNPSQPHRSLDALAAIRDKPRLPIGPRSPKMSRRCQITGKGVLSGNNVSHANNQTRRRFLPNLQDTSLLSDILGAAGPHAALHPRDPHHRTQGRHRRLSARYAECPADGGRQGAEAPAAARAGQAGCRPGGLAAPTVQQTTERGRGATARGRDRQLRGWRHGCCWPMRSAPRRRVCCAIPRRPPSIRHHSSHCCAGAWRTNRWR